MCHANVAGQDGARVNCLNLLVITDALLYCTYVLDGACRKAQKCTHFLMSVCLPVAKRTLANWNHSNCKEGREEGRREGEGEEGGVEIS